MSRTHESPTITIPLLIRRRVLTVSLVLGATLLVLGSVAPTARAAGQGPPPPTATPAPVAPPPNGEPPAVPAPVDVIEVSGYIDAIEADFITRSIAAAEENGSQLLVVQLNSPGALISDLELDELAFRMSHSGVPLAVWVGPNGSRAYGGAVRVVRAAASSGMATSTEIGRFRGDCPLCPPGDPLLTRSTVSSDDALKQGAVDSVSPTLGDFIVDQDGKQLGGRQISTARVVFRDTPRREPIAQVRFAKLTLTQRVLHATTSPSFAYLLLMVGLLLIVFEFFSVGIGVAAVTGAVSLILALYGLGALGPNPLALALIALAIFGYSVDVQAGVPRAWTVIATVALLAGSWLLFPGDRRVGWPAIVIILGGTVVFMLRGMTVMVRSRFSTPVISRESMIGEAAEAATALDPEGMVLLRGARWRARASAAMPVGVGAAVHVVAVDGLVLEVEPGLPAPEADGSQAG